MKLTCNYAVAHFLPYAVTEEFVNIGVILHCRATGFLDFRLARRWGRVTGFFPEMDGNLYRDALQSFRSDLRLAVQNAHDSRQLVMPGQEGFTEAIFSEQVRPRESLFRFGAPKVVLTDTPETKLDELFDFFVERQFARDKEYQETIMTNHLRGLFLREGRGRMFRPGTVGNELYTVNLPFVLMDADTPRKAIKPLDLNKETSTRIIEHGDLWLNRVTRLREIGRLPEEMLFTVERPGNSGPRQDAASEIIDRLEQLDTRVVPFRDDTAVLEFSKVA
ncbi:MAG: DUF3037 domain-containing protein [Terrimicrobiaceae bacterium]